MECLRDEFTDGVVLDGRYQTISPLNHGSFGMVFKARDLRTGETVAIKCLTKKSAADESSMEFAIDDKYEELTLHRHLGRHPNIVNLIHSFETEAHVYLVLEFCHQGDLYEAIRVGQGPLETEHVRRFMLELIDAVAYIHSKGIYHRDIKPENIFLGKDGSLKLGDFGLATTDTWTFESAVGSDRYMSPEQFDSAGAGYSPAQADVWAIGVCLLNILFSRNPFTTPTESDPLFLDFSRDKQSLFDVFPSMSQDTYEVIVECMSMDPSKRSLHGARRALNRVVSFTTLDEGDDDFCSAQRDTIATANREPLRTPSIQSPQVETGAFPWAKALHMTSAAQPIRQLSAIPDDESYTEDLFSKSAATSSWFSAMTPSISSVADSSLPASMQSLRINPQKMFKPATSVSPMAGSLPISMSKPRNVPAMSMVFGGKDTVSKSWTLKMMNSRTWSQDSKADDDDTPRRGLSPVVKSSVIDAKPRVPHVEDAIDIDGDLPDGFFFHDVDPVKHEELHLEDQSPTQKKGSLDKWAKLGERRRAYTGCRDSMPKPDFSLKTGHSAGMFYGFGVGEDHGSAHHNNFTFANHHNHMLNSKHQQTRERVKECPWSKSKGRDFNWNWRREKRLEWVGASPA
ncbi:Serine/threonine-protein kinase ksp1 [Cytospora mali]|uniref:non-specific serine/threonine protein kinase n=1 Tax=Cytospora mali TaxID=578113 RepID=A0A194V953_CYTMA|nr:Serine/threonine-protein kinase ksp1 [Valsa mali var. pyri (nom. inval.)]